MAIVRPRRVAGPRAPGEGLTVLWANLGTFSPLSTAAHWVSRPPAVVIHVSPVADSVGMAMQCMWRPHSEVGGCRYDRYSSGDEHVWFLFFGRRFHTINVNINILLILYVALL